MKRRKKNLVRVASAVFLGVFCLGIAGTSGKATLEKVPYEFEIFEYGTGAKNVSNFDYKQTDSSMVAACLNSSNTFAVRAMGAPLAGRSDTYADCSRGYCYYLSAGKLEDDVINFVREDGYRYAGIKGTYSGDSHFMADGFFITDKVQD